MPELTLELLAQGTSYQFPSGEVRLGRDPNCDMVFRSEEFPMVGRQHAVLRTDSGAWSVEDLQSTNGTYVNQMRVQRQRLSPGDTLRLGSDGPEIRVQFVDETALPVTRSAALAAAAGAALTHTGARRPSDMPLTPPNVTAALTGTQLAPGMTSEPPPTRPVVSATAPSLAPTKPSSRKYSSSVTTNPAAQEDQQETVESEDSPAVAAQEQQEETSEEEDPMNEQRLSLLRNLVILMVGLVLVLGGIVISQMQQIADIRQNVREMRADARTAVGKFQPELDKRLTKMETNMDAMDDRIQKAQDAMDIRMQKSQDAFFARLDKELPKILDKYVEQKKAELLSEAAAGRLPR